LVAASVAWHLLPATTHAGAEPPKGRQKWEYASLIEFLPPAQTPYRLVWRTGKQRLVVESKNIPEGLSKLHKALGGADLGDKEETPRFLILLDRIGQDGWELVTHTHLPPDTQTWNFKRPAP
jgi:hypothetical protein